MKLAFSGEAHLPNFDDGFGLYTKRVRNRVPLDCKSYRKVLKLFCASLAERLCEHGMVDLPSGLGTLAVARIKRKPQYRGDKFIGYGTMSWKHGYYDGSPESFGVVFLPNRQKGENMRCYGFVTNRALYKRLKKIYESYDRPWSPLEFNDEMI